MTQERERKPEVIEAVGQVLLKWVTEQRCRDREQGYRRQEAQSRNQLP